MSQLGGREGRTGQLIVLAMMLWRGERPYGRAKAQCVGLALIGKTLSESIVTSSSSSYMVAQTLEQAEQHIRPGGSWWS